MAYHNSFRLENNEAKLKKIKDKMIELAKRKTWIDDEDFNADEYSGGNFDDAYSAGLSDGKTLFARSIVKMIDAESDSKTSQ